MEFIDATIYLNLLGIYESNIYNYLGVIIIIIFYKGR